MKTALIFGINGQDGFYLSNFLKKKNYVVIGYSKPNGEFADIRSRKLVEDTIKNIAPNEIYNLVGQIKDRQSFEYPYDVTSVICEGTLNILESIKNINTKIKYFQPSSSEIYGRSGVHVDEKSAFSPVTPYGAARLFAQNLTNSYRNKYNIHASSGILFSHESPRRDKSYVTRKITNTAARIKMGLEDSLILDNIESYRDWGFAGDYVKAMWAMLQQEHPGDYVISTGTPTSVLEFVNIVFDIAKIKNIFRYVQFKDASSTGIIGNNKKAREKLGWYPEHNIHDIAKMMYEYDIKEVKHEN
jgi:GDPmannose 4,6-dehydratase